MGWPSNETITTLGTSSSLVSSSSSSQSLPPVITVSTEGDRLDYPDAETSPGQPAGPEATSAESGAVAIVRLDVRWMALLGCAVLWSVMA